jgi:hypothetical protein
VSTTLFEQLQVVSATFRSPPSARKCSLHGLIVQSLTVLTQVFLTGRIAQRRRHSLLTIVPILMIFGFLRAVNKLLLFRGFHLSPRGQYAFCGRAARCSGAR